MKNVKTLLIFVAISTFVFGSWTRTNALGGAGYWADDYSNINAFPASVNDHTVAYTSGNDFTSIFNHNGTTWGFSGGDRDDVAKVKWGNGTMGAYVNLSMTPAVDGGADASNSFSGGFGMPLSDMDFGITYASGGAIGVNLRRAQDVFVWDNMLINVGMTPEDFEDGADTQSNTSFGATCYSNRSYDGGTSGLFALGFAYSDDGPATDGGTDPDASMMIDWTFAVESEMTDWATLRLSYTHGHDFGSGATPAIDEDGSIDVGLGFNYGSFALDLAIGQEIFTNPVVYMTGQNRATEDNDNALATSFTISYTW